jgi:ATP-binding cassette subfamily F protein 3
MIVLRLDKVTFSYPGGLVLEELSWAIKQGDKLGLVGPNGAGKSTILKLLAGLLSPDAGLVVAAKGVTLGYLPQEVGFAPGRTVLQEALTASPRLAELDTALHRLEATLADPVVYNDEKVLTATLEEQARLLQAYEEAGGLSYENTVKATLRQLGFAEAEFELTTTVLSGGQKKMLALAKLTVNGPTVLLLDEPDNHLDLAGKTLLEKFIRDYPGAVIIVSHDRYLLDLVVEEIVEVTLGRLTHYPGNYSEYVFERETRLLRQQELYQIQQREITRLEEVAKRFLTWAKVYDNPKFARRGHAIMSRLERMDRIERPILEHKRMELALDGWRGSDKVLEIMDLDKAFGDNLILAGVNLTLWHGSRVGLIGPNGAGKSVLFRCIIGQETPTSGVIKIGPSVKLGVYTQEHQNLDYSKNLIETVRDLKPMYEDQAVSFLGKFLFPYMQAKTQRVGSLSGGERSRLQMALIMLQEPNFLLWDEPTNNLDIQSAEVLEQTLDSFNGTVFVISHDRYFLDRVVGAIVELDPDRGTLTEYIGGYTDYLAARLNHQNSAQRIGRERSRV